jgi:hypothetical protein
LWTFSLFSAHSKRQEAATITPVHPSKTTMMHDDDDDDDDDDNDDDEMMMMR